MPKGQSHHTADQKAFLDLLKETRAKAKLTRGGLATLAGVPQPYVSQVESGKIRLDTLQLRDWLYACGSNLGRFGRALEKRLHCSQPLSEGSNDRERISWDGCGR